MTPQVEPTPHTHRGERGGPPWEGGGLGGGLIACFTISFSAPPRTFWLLLCTNIAANMGGRPSRVQSALNYSHCKHCGLEWKNPDPLNGKCTQCNVPVEDGHLHDHLQVRCQNQFHLESWVCNLCGCVKLAKVHLVKAYKSTGKHCQCKVKFHPTQVLYFCTRNYM